MGSPTYFVDGRPATEAWCGETSGSTITFDIPGYDRAWVTVTQNGAVTFDQPMALPMPPYTLRCPEDVGFFFVTGYELTPDGRQGNPIGQTSLTVRGVSETPSDKPVTRILTIPPAPAPPAPTGTPPPMGKPLYLDGGSGGDGGGVTFRSEPEPPSTGLDLTTIALIVGAVLILPRLLKKG